MTDKIVFLPNKQTHHYLRWLIHAEILDLRSMVSRAKHAAGVDLMTELTDEGESKGRVVVCLARLLRQFIKGVLRNSLETMNTTRTMDSLGPADFHHDYPLLLEPMLIETVRSISFVALADAMLTLDQRQRRNGEH